MSNRDTPEWFVRSEAVYRPIQERISAATNTTDLPVHLAFAPLEAAYFLVGALQLSYDANKMGIHANALSQTRYCIEALSIIELGICRAKGREEVLADWLKGKIPPGKVRKWLASEVWPSYGSGLWSESWEEFMAKLAGAIQPYSHYTAQLAQWQSRFHFAEPEQQTGYIEIGPSVYDPQKATRITLYHSILYYALGRIWLGNDTSNDSEFDAAISSLGNALGKSRYLDGQQTDWDKQFWAMVWDNNTGETILE